MSDIATYRADLDVLLATAVDSATWPTALKDEALARGLWDFDGVLIYESELTVTTAGQAQDVSSLSALDEVLAVAWPWRTGGDFGQLAVRWRTVDDHVIYLERSAAPQVGDVIRVRHTRRHTIEGLGGASATTVPSRHAPLVTLVAALWAIALRLRQISENPALPAQAMPGLHALRRELQARYDLGLARVLNWSPVRWGVGEG